MGILTKEEMQQLTGYKQYAAQLRWLDRYLNIKPPIRADGHPVVTHSQLELSLRNPTELDDGEFNWSKP